MRPKNEARRQHFILSDMAAQLASRLRQCVELDRLSFMTDEQYRFYRNGYYNTAFVPSVVSPNQVRVSIYLYGTHYWDVIANVALQSFTLQVYGVPSPIKTQYDEIDELLHFFTPIHRVGVDYAHQVNTEHTKRYA